MTTPRKVWASSTERYNGGVRIKRLWGSSTVTRFYVGYAGDENDPSKWMKIEGYGKTPGERKTYAIHAFRKAHGEQVPDLASIQNILR
jgi:hypothetical protein